MPSPDNISAQMYAGKISAEEETNFRQKFSPPHLRYREGQCEFGKSESAAMWISSLSSLLDNDVFVVLLDIYGYTFY